MAAGTAQLAAAAPALETGIAGAATGADQLASGASDVAAGARALATGTATLAGSAPALAGAVSDAAAGAKDVASGAGQVDAGRLQARERGAEPGERGADGRFGRVPAGGRNRSRGASGVSQLASASRRVVDGARMVAAETDGLASDGQAVAADAQRLTDGLRSGATSGPVLSDAERQAVGAAVADPVAVESQSIDGTAPAGAGLAPSFMALAVWVGVLATYLVLPALPARIRRSDRGSGALAWFVVAAVLGVVQILLMVVALRWAVGIDVARLPELMALAVFAMVAAVAVVQALVALFGTRGWFVALLLVVLQAAASGAWYPIETAPGFFQALHPLLPMTYTVEAFRTLIAGGAASIVQALVVLVLWTLAALAMTLLANRLRTSHTGPRPEPLPVGGGAG